MFLSFTRYLNSLIKKLLTRRYRQMNDRHNRSAIYQHLRCGHPDEILYQSECKSNKGKNSAPTQQFAHK